MQWPTIEDPAKAKIAPDATGKTFGIRWSNFESLEFRGGYSGPFNSREEAAEAADSWREHYGLPEGSLIIEQAESFR